MVATGLAAVHTNLRRLHENKLFLTPRRSLAHIGTIYIVSGFAH